MLDHEREHRRRHDPLRLLTGQILARTLFFVPGLRTLAFDAHSGSPQGAGIDPLRADALLGEEPDWRFPLAVCLAASAALTVVILVCVLVGQLATGAATLDAPFLSGQPCVLILALAPALLVWTAWRLARPWFAG